MAAHLLLTIFSGKALDHDCSLGRKAKGIDDLLYFCHICILRRVWGGDQPKQVPQHFSHLQSAMMSGSCMRCNDRDVLDALQQVLCDCDVERCVHCKAHAGC